MGLAQPRQLREGFLERQNIEVGTSIWRNRGSELDPRESTAALRAGPRSGVVHEYLPHHLGGQRKKMAAILELQVRLPGKANPGFMHDGGRLQGVSSPLPG